ncbi:phenazine biosynthesis protein phzE [Saccharothrix carnea]|uniref:anthranilate synthase n=1 Tax=Saccharothrix carnea TaxID=1280637 RepID=A0A2P8I1A1_SACCR|nr:anthranilate synthase family protein [Saccharothrix carnea]PSL52245.1 phenazine biosynthesis protein phzE [Saccharothrix carnea]
MTGDLLDRVLAGPDRPFALLHRTESGRAVVDVLVGDVTTPDVLADIALPTGPVAEARHDVLAVVPFRQIRERGYVHRDDGEPLLALTVADQAVLPLDDVLSRLPDVPLELARGRFDTDDDSYAEIVRRVLADEIGEGEGANFVIRRAYVADIVDYSPRSALSLFRRLLLDETGAYWTFVVHTGDRTFVGATPERHISVTGGTAVMNPISGTYRYPPTGPALRGVLDFLADNKESDELYMVLDEELKMMGRICPDGGRVHGPYLREMARLAHTEYFIAGRTDRDPRDILRETMFAPTVTGSPLESACKVISRHEPDGRAYYSGVVALIGREPDGSHSLDSSILIRTAAIDGGGTVRVDVGATLVRHSDPLAEVAETRAKAAGLLAALGSDPSPRSDGRVGFAEHPEVRDALRARNVDIAGFWLSENGSRAAADPALAGLRVLIVDAEDTFTSMLAHQLRSLGLEVVIRRFDEPYDVGDADLVLMGPGPGDPRESGHPKIAHLQSTVDRLLAERVPFLAVCLSHQVLSSRLGLPLVRRDVPNQGVQLGIDLFGTPRRVGFYNTFAASSESDVLHHPRVGAVEISRDPATGQVHALRGSHFASIQFHAESVLTQDGPAIIGSLLTGLTGVLPRPRGWVGQVGVEALTAGGTRLGTRPTGPLATGPRPTGPLAGGTQVPRAQAGPQAAGPTPRAQTPGPQPSGTWAMGGSGLSSNVEASPWQGLRRWPQPPV